MRVLWFLRGGENQTWIRRRILRLEFLHGLKVRRVSDNFGKLLQLLELIQFRSSLFLFSNTGTHNKFSVWTSCETYASIKRSTTIKSGYCLLRDFTGASNGVCPLSYAETAGRASAVRFEPSAALTKLFPSSHIGPGNLRHSVSTSSSASTNKSTSFSPMMSGGRIFSTSIAWPATCVRMRCLLNIWVTIICANSTLSILWRSFHAILSLNSRGS